MVERFSLKIADIKVGLMGRDHGMRLKVEGATRAFLVPETSPDLTIYAAWDELSNSVPGEKVFDAGGLWQLYRENGTYLFRFTTPTLGACPYRVAGFNEDFTVGQVRLHRPYFPTDGAVYPLEYPLDELLIVNWLARGKGVELHACGLVDSAGRGHLFVGQSRAGKTTTARLWQNREGIEILSDDRIIVRKREGRLWIYGTPWHGEARLASPSGAPLTRLYFLKHGQENELAEQRPAETVGRLLAASFVPFYDAAAMEFTLDFLNQLAADIPCRELRFVPDATAVEYVLRA